VYCDIYKEDPFGVRFSLTPMPRLEIESVEDIKILHEIGALTPDLSLRLSRVLVGEEPFQNNAKRRRTQAQNEQKQSVREKQAPSASGKQGKNEQKGMGSGRQGENEQKGVGSGRQDQNSGKPKPEKGLSI
jgi:hypothetical protein